jgi:hypothetical protein
MAKIDMFGKVYSYWTVTKKWEKRKNGYYWLCKCICGTERFIQGNDLRRGKSKSCGCKRAEFLIKSRGNHGCGGKNKTSEYYIWCSMRRRCNSKEHKNYARYGGRGIKICERWNDFKNFLFDMGLKPGPNYSLGRIDNNSNYEPNNCRWETMSQQQNNRSSNKKIFYEDKEYTLTLLAKKFDLHPDTLGYRLRNGWPLEKALTLKADTRNRLAVSQ